MARTKLPAVKRREYTVEEYNALFHAGRKGGGTGTGTGRGRGGISRAARWDARLVEVKAWVVRHRRYPGQSNTSAETSMYYWLYHNLPGKPSHTPDRWKKLNDAFGEGWEADFGKKARESQLETNGTSNDEPRSRIVQGEDPDRVRVLVVDCWLLVAGCWIGRGAEMRGGGCDAGE